eukprot:6359108-Alexandrium_andersonii.AAC.2
MSDLCTVATAQAKRASYVPSMCHSSPPHTPIPSQPTPTQPTTPRPHLKFQCLAIPSSRKCVHASMPAPTHLPRRVAVWCFSNKAFPTEATNSSSWRSHKLFCSEVTSLYHFPAIDADDD